MTIVNVDHLSLDVRNAYEAHDYTAHTKALKRLADVARLAQQEPTKEGHLARSHDGDIILVQEGKPNQIIAACFSPLWSAIVRLMVQAKERS
jgi:hypothetical protein